MNNPEFDAEKYKLPPDREEGWHPPGKVNTAES
jgi:hypothetical protein